MRIKQENATLIGKLINSLFVKYRTNIQFTNSLFAFIPKILNEGLFRGQILFEFTKDFLNTCKAFLKKVTFRKLNIIYPTISWLTVLCKGDQRKQSFSILAPLFVCEYPVIRDKAAISLNEAFDVESIFDDDEENDDDDDDDDNNDFVEKVQNILTSKNWKDDFDQCAEGVTDLCSVFGVDVPVIEQKEVKPQDQRKFTYGNLVKDAL